MTVLHDGMAQAPMAGMPEVDRVGAGGIGGRPGVGMWAVLEGSKVGRLRVLLVLAEAGPAERPLVAVTGMAPAGVDVSDALVLLAAAAAEGGEYGGMDSPFEMVVW